MNIVRDFSPIRRSLLDEPTLGLDVGASREVRRFVRSWWMMTPRARSCYHTLHGGGR